MPSMFDIGTGAGTAAAGNDSRFNQAKIFNAGTSFSNTTSTTSVLSSGAISSGWPAGATVGDTVRLIAAGYYLNSSGANQTWSWLLKFGSTTIASGGPTAAIGTNANKRRWTMDVTLVYLAIGASSNVLVTGNTALSLATTTTFDNLQAAATTYWTGGTIVGSLNTSAGDTLDIQCTHSTNTATSTSACEGLTVLYFPKTT